MTKQFITKTDLIPKKPTPNQKQNITIPIAWLRTTSFYLPFMYIFELTANKMLRSYD